MAAKQALQLGEEDVLFVTDRGKAQLSTPGTTLSTAELQMLLLAEDRVTVAEVVKRAQGMRPDEVMEALGKLLESRHLESASGVETSVVDAGDYFSASAGSQPRGCHVAIARRAAAEHKPAAGKKLNVLTVESEPGLAKLLRSYLTLEGFVPRSAASGAELVAELRRPPLPDLVLLDAALPDIGGHEVLVKMRQHPVLKSVPTIMLAGTASREMVAKGLQAGVDGFITKPFEVEVLLTAAKSVLGLSGVPAPAQPAQGDAWELESS